MNKDVPDEGDPLDNLVGNNLPVPTRVRVDHYFVVRLAQEVAMHIREVPEILEAYRLTQAEFELIEKLELYQRAHEQFLIEWTSAKSTPERLRIEAAASLEAAMPTLAARLQDRSEDLLKAVEVAKLFAKISGTDTNQHAGGNPADKFSITINLGEDVKLKFEKDVAPTEPDKPMIDVSPK